MCLRWPTLWISIVLEEWAMRAMARLPPTRMRCSSHPRRRWKARNGSVAAASSTFLTIRSRSFFSRASISRNAWGIHLTDQGTLQPHYFLGLLVADALSVQGFQACIQKADPKLVGVFSLVIARRHQGQQFVDKFVVGLAGAELQFRKFFARFGLNLDGSISHSNHYRLVYRCYIKAFSWASA